jgi:hypothetical protein
MVLQALIVVGLVGCSTPAPPPPKEAVTLEATWESPTSIHVTVHAREDVCLFDRALVPAGPEHVVGKGPYTSSERGHQFSDPDTCELVISLSNQEQRGASHQEFFNFQAARCVDAGTSFSRTVEVPSPWSYWHPLETSPRVLSYQPAAVRVEVGFLPPAGLDFTPRSLVGGGTLPAPEAKWMDKALPSFLEAQRFATASLPLPEKASLLQQPGVDAPHTCPRDAD